MGAMANNAPRLVRIGDVQLACQFCSYQLFYDREIMMNTSGLTMFDLDWLNRSAIGLICAQCSHVMLFAGNNVRLYEPPPAPAPPEPPL
jgi:hypothetical protein